MSERLHATVSIGAYLPGFLPRVVSALLGSAAALVLVPGPFGYLGIALAVVGAVFPATLGTWGCALVIALAQLGRAPVAADWHPYATLAIVHVLHVLSSLAIVVEPGGVLQLRALKRPALGWLAIQVPAQVVLIVVLLVGSTHVVPAAVSGIFAAVAAACVGTVVVLVVRRRR